SAGAGGLPAPAIVALDSSIKRKKAILRIGGSLFHTVLFVGALVHQFDAKRRTKCDGHVFFIGEGRVRAGCACPIGVPVVAGRHIQSTRPRSVGVSSMVRRLNRETQRAPYARASTPDVDTARCSAPTASVGLFEPKLRFHELTRLFQIIFV